MKVLVIDDGDSLRGLPDKPRRGVSYLEWPCGRGSFLEKTASALGVAPRRTFKAFIRIFVPAAEYGAVGRSADFSMTGMSFTSASFFSIGQKISVSVSFPREERNILLEGRISRSRADNGGHSTLYGVEFGDIDQDIGEALKAFVLA